MPGQFGRVQCYRQQGQANNDGHDDHGGTVTAIKPMGQLSQQHA